MKRQAWVCLASALLVGLTLLWGAGCSTTTIINEGPAEAGTSTSDGAAGGGACDAYLACLKQVADQSGQSAAYNQAVAEYGSGGTCAQSASAMQACEQACQQPITVLQQSGATCSAGDGGFASDGASGSGSGSGGSSGSGSGGSSGSGSGGSSGSSSGSGCIPADGTYTTTYTPGAGNSASCPTLSSGTSTYPPDGGAGDGGLPAGCSETCSGSVLTESCSSSENGIEVSTTITLDITSSGATGTLMETVSGAD